MTVAERIILAALVVTIGVIAGILAGMGLLWEAVDDRTTVTTPDGMCPTEDACAVGYAGGVWTVETSAP